jgi:hypothetical protein
MGRLRTWVERVMTISTFLAMVLFLIYFLVPDKIIFTTTHPFWGIMILTAILAAGADISISINQVAKKIK